MRKDQKGFSVSLIILVLVIVGAIGLTGFVVYSRRTNDRTTTSNDPCYTSPNQKITPTSEPSVKCLEENARVADPLIDKRPEVTLDLADGGNIDPCGHKIPAIGYAPATYQFKAIQDAGPAKVTTYFFTFGDGTQGSTHDGEISHTYAEPGQYSVGLTAIDVKGIKTFGNTGTTLTVYKPGQLDRTSQMWKDRLQTDPNACQGS